MSKIGATPVTVTLTSAPDLLAATEYVAIPTALGGESVHMA